MPFKPTALRQKPPPKPAAKSDDDEDNDSGDDGSSLFNRGASVFEQEQERRMKRKQAERERSTQEHSPVADRTSPPRTSEGPFEENGHHDRYAAGPASQRFASRHIC